MTMAAHHLNLAKRIELGLAAEPDDWGIFPPPNQPMATARALFDDLYTAANGAPLLAWWRGQFWHYRGTHWVAPMDIEATTGPIWEHLEKQVFLNGKDDNGDDKLVQWTPTPKRVSDVLTPLKIVALQKGENTPPFSTTGGDTPENIVSMANGLFDINNRKLKPHTPDHFTTWSLDFDYDPEAQCPKWKAFLADVFEHDADGAELLREFMGYLISGRTNLQKALMLIGATGAGKGVIATVIRALMGANNVATLTLDGIARNDAILAGCIGKPLGVMEDARDAHNAGKRAVERLLSLIADDPIGLDRKYKDAWFGPLGMRLLFVSNELPRFSDASGAILRRFEILRLEKSFVGREDPNLAKKLLTELPGIFVWSLEGLDQLDKNKGKFTRPKSAETLQETMRDLTRPLDEFFDWAEDNDKLEITGNPTDVMPAKDLNQVYRVWCDLEGRSRMNSETLAQKITAAYSNVQHRNSKLDDNGQWAADLPKRRVYIGVKPINTNNWSIAGNVA